VSLVGSALERRGIATVMLSVLPEVTAALVPPRALAVPFGLGSPVGPPGDLAMQVRVVRAALELTTDPRLPVSATFDAEA
jgi:hypothetical protein